MTRSLAPLAQAVLDFWFGAEHAPEFGTLRAEWFRKDPAFDAAIAGRFGALVQRALRGELAEWDAQPAGALARILLLDQFARNLYRDTAQAFAGDALALEAARTLVDAGQDTALRAEQRVFAYLPFEHSEDMAMQEESLRLFKRLAAQVPALAGYLDYAHRHHVVVARFGRFPHRNEALGRASTSEELAFLQEPGSRF